MKSVLLFLCLSMLTLSCGLGPDMTKDRIPASPTPTPFQAERPIADYIRDGDSAYTSGNFGQAVEPYKRAFEIEQREQKLEEKQRNSLIRNLAMSYIRTGDTDKARLTIAYGVSKDFDYPLFHYTLACSFAADGDEGTAIYRLRNAYRFRNKLPSGETFPDPLTEGCFESFSDSETFKKAVTEMKASKPGTTTAK